MYIIMHLAKKKICGLNYNCVCVVHENQNCRDNEY